MTSPFFTIGHSTRAVTEFVDLLKGEQVRLLVDVRTVPRSRSNPQFNDHVLPQTLAQDQIGYERIAALGGLRGKQHEVAPDVNAFWQNQSFHNYADYGLTEAFHSGLARLCTLGQEPRCAIMRRGGLVAVSPPYHRRLPDRGGQDRIPYSRPRSHRAGAHDCGGSARAGRVTDLSGRRSS
jgi:hypothetical protein